MYYFVPLAPSSLKPHELKTCVKWCGTETSCYNCFVNCGDQCTEFILINFSSSVLVSWVHHDTSVFGEVQPSLRTCLPPERAHLWAAVLASSTPPPCIQLRTAFMPPSGSSFKLLPLLWMLSWIPNIKKKQPRRLGACPDVARPFPGWCALALL